MTTAAPTSRSDGETRPAPSALLLAAALRYAATGLPVVAMHTPVRGGCSCRAGPDCGSAGKHPRLRHGLHDASTDPQLIRAWWSRWPSANVGVATGTVLDVCDVDTPGALRRLLDLLDVIRPAGPLVRTGQGWHVWYAAAGLPSRVAVMASVDWRGTGGLVVVPPSWHATGRRYTFAQPFTAGPLPAVPPALHTLVASSVPPAITPHGTRAVAPVVPAGVGEVDVDRYGQAALDGEIRRILSAPRPVVRGGQRVAGGGRNVALNTAAFRLGQLSAAAGLDAGEVWPRLTDAATTAGLPVAEVRRTIASGWQAGLRFPRAPRPRSVRLSR
ncbi:bifunctional DNA primase/polymerase [Krasilnikovia sp. M28-CT-15]|uniref:bifunctional DNA primase/polymerase n=1 Tax=Krasilnikovia sp. M28-CT-15 TaxID=3373540 RepID=UPI003875E3C3